MIEVKNLTKKYGSFYAVRNISLTVEKGHIYGFLGPNGAGKSTTMNIISGCLAATDGSVTVNGFDIYEDAVKAKRCIGYLPETPPLYTDMTPREYLKFVGRSKGIKKSDISGELEAVMKKTGIENVADKLIKNLSKGYKQRVGIAQALLGNPEYIILDEPTVGLDPLQLIDIRELIISLKEEHGVILSSHIMGEIESVCDFVTMIHGGKIVASDSYEVLEKNYSDTACFKILGDKKMITDLLAEVDGITYSKISENGRFIKAVIEGKDIDALCKTITALFEKENIEIISEDRSFSLENYFVKLMEGIAPEDGEKKETSHIFKVSAAQSPLGGAYLEDGADGNIPINEETSEKTNYKPLFGEDDEYNNAENSSDSTDKGGEING